MVRKTLLSLLIVALSLTTYHLSERKLPFLDLKADKYFTDTTTEAAIAYATVRGVNGVVSVLKESQVEFSPAGVGINIAAGQILDPIDDMTERLSAVLVTALVSLGIQKVFMEIGEIAPLKAAALLFLLLIPFLWLGPGGTTFFSLTIKICCILMIFRLFLPLSSYVNDYFYQRLFQEKISNAEKQLSVISANYKELHSLDGNHREGILSSLTQAPKERYQQARTIFKQVSSHLDEIIGALLELTISYISIFILQVILIPLGTLWLMILIVNSSFKNPLIGSIVIPCRKSDSPQNRDETSSSGN